MPYHIKTWVRVLIRAILGIAMFLGASWPVHAQAPRLKLPFTPGTTWQITQGYNTDSHGGNAACPLAGVIDPSEGLALYALDFVPSQHSNKAVFAAADGTVWRRNDASLGGILIKHDNGYFTGYMHMKNIRVNPGDQVTGGQTQIGEVDSVGISSGEHLHFFLVKRKASASDYPLVQGTRASFPLGTGDWEPSPLSFEGQDFPPHAGPSDCNKHAGASVTVPASGTPAPTAGTATVLVLDVSDSMRMTWQGGVKIDSAKNAATDILHMIEQENTLGGVTHQVAIVSFATQERLELPLTGDCAQARDIVSALRTRDRTNIGAALTQANQALQNAPGGARKIVILLSDGLTNEGLPPDQILSGPVQDAANAGTCIYTIGFGDPGELDEDLLRRIAEATGCSYYYATDAYQLDQIYIKLRHESVGTKLAEFSGQVQQGQTVTAGQVDVPANQEQLLVTLNWPGSQLELKLTDPQGRTVDPTAPGVTVSTYARLVYLIIKNPTAGRWNVAVYGREVSGVTNYHVVLSSRQGVVTSPPAITPLAPASDFDAAPWIVLAFLVGGTMVAVVAVVLVVLLRSQPMGAGSQAGVYVLDGPLAGRFVRLRQGALGIGRDPRNELALASDEQLSRLHARIQGSPGGFVIHDLNSTNGTLVDGTKIASAPLFDGAEIQVGNTRLVFRSGR